MEQEGIHDALMTSIKHREKINKLNVWGRVTSRFTYDSLLEVEDTLKGTSCIRPIEPVTKLIKDYLHDSTHKDS